MTAHMWRTLLRNLGKTLAFALVLNILGVIPVVLLMTLHHYGYARILPYDSLDLIREEYQSGTIQQFVNQSLSQGTVNFEQFFLDFFNNWVSLLIFEKHDLLFFILGLMIGLLTTNTALLTSLGVLLTVRRIVTGWLTGLELAVIGAAIMLELLPLGTDLTLLPIVWAILTWRTTFWLALGAHISRFFVEQFPPRGMFALMIRFVGFLGLFFALLDVLGFGIMGMLPRQWM